MISRAQVKRQMMAFRFRAEREQLETFEALLPKSQGQNLALTVLYVPYSLDARQLRHRYHLNLKTIE